ncbi:MAG: hypothetical protein R3E79_24375 [Caldilineaceae bacterium]
MGLLLPNLSIGLTKAAFFARILTGILEYGFRSGDIWSRISGLQLGLVSLYVGLFFSLSGGLVFGLLTGLFAAISQNVSSDIAMTTSLSDLYVRFKAVISPSLHFLYSTSLYGVIAALIFGLSLGFNPGFRQDYIVGLCNGVRACETRYGSAFTLIDIVSWSFLPGIIFGVIAALMGLLRQVRSVDLASMSRLQFLTHLRYSLITGLAAGTLLGVPLSLASGLAEQSLSKLVKTTFPCNSVESSLGRSLPAASPIARSNAPRRTITASCND